MYVLLGIMSFIMAIAFIANIIFPKTGENIFQKNTYTDFNTNNKDEVLTDSDNTVIEATSETTTLELTAEQKQTVVDFYKNTVFVGDSIMSGFAMYSKEPEIMNEITFLSAASYGVDAALKNTGIMYQGESKPLIEHLKVINPDKIFINLGVNELNGVPAKKVGDKYGQLIENIKEAVPDSDIYVMGVTYFVEGKETETYNNATIREYNSYIQENAENWGITYIDLPSKLSDSKGYLPAEWSSDGRIHHNQAGYDQWMTLLKETALKYSNTTNNNTEEA